MKIGVVGTFIRDRIFPWQGEEFKSIGGIFFTVSYLANLLDSSAEIYPVCFVGEDFYDDLTTKLSEYSNLRFDGIKKIPRKNTQVTLTYTGPQERNEVTTQPMPALTYDELAVFEDVDAVIINLITGVDVDLEALRKFRQTSNALIYLDFHSRALGIDAAGKRYYRRPDDWQEWVNLVDVLQLNEMEARTLAGQSKDFPEENLIDFGANILKMRPAVCHITIADRGSYLFYRNSNETRSKRFKGFRLDRVVDIIGCGDAFAAAYLVNFFDNGDIAMATGFANQVAALNCTFLGSEGIKEIWNLIETESELIS